MARKNLYINDVNIGTYGIYISSDTILNSPQIDYTAFSVPGKNGSVLQYNKRMDNVVRKFTCHVPLKTQVASALANLKKLIYTSPGYLKISSDYETDTYQMGYLAQPIDVKPFNAYRTATFDLYFSCRPQKYDKTSESTLYGSGTSGMVSILPRNNSLVQKVLSYVESAFVVDADYYGVIMHTNNFASVSITNLNLYKTGGGSNLIYMFNTTSIHPAKESEFSGFKMVVSRSEGVSLTLNGYTAYLVPLIANTQPRYQVTLTSSNSTNYVCDKTIAPNKYISKNTAVGGSFVFSIDYAFDKNTAFNDTSILFRFVSTNTITGYMSVSVIWNDMSEDVLDYLDTLANNGTLTITYDLNNQDAYIGDFHINNFVVMEGNVPFCNRVDIFVEEGSTNGYPTGYATNTRWWEV